MKILAFGASHSKASINRQFALYGALALATENDNVNLLDLNTFEVPIFTVDVEREMGYPNAVYAFIEEFQKADIIIISFAEHNGSYSASFKNLFDWSSRVEPRIFNEKPTILLSTSTGARGGKSVLAAALDRMPRHGAKIIGHFSLPSFNENFKDQVIINEAILFDFQTFIADLKSKIV